MPENWHNKGMSSDFEQHRPTDGRDVLWWPTLKASLSLHTVALVIYGMLGWVVWLMLSEPEEMHMFKLIKAVLTMLGVFAVGVFLIVSGVMLFRRERWVLDIIREILGNVWMGMWLFLITMLGALIFKLRMDTLGVGLSALFTFIMVVLYWGCAGLKDSKVDKFFN